MTKIEHNTVVWPSILNRISMKVV